MSKLNMISRKMILVMILLLSLTILSACSDDEVNESGVIDIIDDDDDDDVDCLITPEDPECMPDITGPGIVNVLDELPSDPITITFWHGYSSYNEDLLDDFIDEFELLYPNITVNALNNGYITELAAIAFFAYGINQAPTMVLGYGDQIAKLSPAWVPLDDFIYDDNFGININDYIGDFVNESKQFEDGYMTSLPFSKTTDVVVINKTLFEANGLIVKTDEPYSWAELDELSSILVGDGANQCEYLINYDHPEKLFITGTYQWDGEYTNASGDVLIDNANTKAMMDYIRIRFENNTFAIPTVWGELFGDQKFKSEDVCMSVTAVGGVGYYVPSNDEFEIAMGMLPQYDTSNPVYNQFGPSIAIINSASDAERLAAWLFMTYITNTENSARWAINSHYSPVRYSSYVTDIYTDYLNNPSTENTYFSMAMNAAYLQIDHYQYVPAFYTSPIHYGSASVRQEAELAIKLLLAGNSTTEEIIDAFINNLD